MKKKRRGNTVNAGKKFEQIKIIIKAGMTGLDKEKINQIIENASKGSKFYAKQKENQARSEYEIIV